MAVLLFSLVSCREQWPSNDPLPGYAVRFRDGCMESNLHNISDRPSNFPTLETLHRGQRPPFYSDAYDSNNATSSTNSRMARVNPAVKEVIASKATMVTMGSIPQGLSTTWEALHPNVSLSRNDDDDIT